MWIMMAVVAGIPLVFVPFIQDFYDAGKWYALAAVGLLSLALWIGQYLFAKRSLHIEFSQFALGLLALSVSSGVSVLFSSTNKIEAVLSPFGPIAFVSLLLLVLTVASFTSAHTRHQLRWFVYGSSTVLSLIAVYQSIGIGKSMFPALTFLADPLWTPTGSSISTITILLLVLPLMLQDVIVQLKGKKESHAAISIMMFLTTIVGISVTIWKFIPQAQSALLPFSVGWSITLEILKNLKRTLIGIGAENFLTAFSLGRPQSYNVSPVWNIRFTTNANMLFHMTTIYGLTGLASILLLAKSLLPRHTITIASASVYLACAALLFAPPSLAVLYMITLIYLISPHTQKSQQTIKPLGKVWGKGILTLVMIIAIGGSGYGVYRSYAAEHIFYSSLQKARENNGTQTYNMQIRAIQENPFISKYHLIYSQTNLALAVSLTNAINQASEKENAEQKTKDQQLVAQLIQQSIREAKLATTLNTQSVLAWENLARIYNQLIDIAQGADTWTIASYTKAIELDPYNPILRLELGSVAMKKKQYTEAITQFQKSASLKQNYANAYYNLAYAYKESGDLKNTISALKMTQSLLDKSSSDYEKVRKDIESLSEAKE